MERRIVSSRSNRAARIAELRTESEDPHVVRFTPERSREVTRQRRIMRSESFIEVPKEMYRRGRMTDLE